ncbi:hypothetical protein FDA94_07600 [Herbidospora galbida]|uniref:Uncharacterized protein n=1 Tax=Herbidospora galbida TaxID=2575442 RepID=A0A4U3MLA3_9ACTN|nr:hypothetical protein [Herbidospora galbida]TKK89750.1 hypothetical protein FDA94_07600 [Herbidospora galbida]
MSNATLTRLLKGQCVRFPRWRTVANFIRVCRDSLESTDVNADVEIGTLEEWHARWKHLNDLHLGNATAAIGQSASVNGLSAESQVAYVPRHASDSRLLATYEHIRVNRWFGPRGAELLDWAKRGQPLAAFELGILLLLRGLRTEGSESLQQAAGLDDRLQLTLRLREDEQLYGRIPSDICRRVGIGYAFAGSTNVARQWHEYARSLNGIPMIGILEPPGRHAMIDDVIASVRHSPLDPGEVLHIDAVYHGVYAWTPESEEEHEILPMPPLSLVGANTEGASVGPVNLPPRAPKAGL